MITKTPLLIGIPSTIISPKIEAQLRRINPKGIILFGRNYESEPQLKQFIKDVRLILGDEIIIAVDHEGGRVVRFPEILPRLPSPSVLGKELNPTRIYQLSRETGSSLRELGINFNLAPVVDVATPISHFSLRNRCYSSDPVWVAEMGVAFVMGMHDAGIKCTAKHFPGLGLGCQDTHESGTMVTASREKLEQHWLPFRKMIAAGIDAILISHAVYPALDPTRPATFSRSIITEILRKQMGFTGLIISDDLLMGAITNYYSIQDAVINCLAAGCDSASVCFDSELGFYSDIY